MSTLHDTQWHTTSVFCSSSKHVSDIEKPHHFLLQNSINFPQSVVTFSPKVRENHYQFIYFWPNAQRANCINTWILFSIASCGDFVPSYAEIYVLLLIWQDWNKCYDNLSKIFLVGRSWRRFICGFTVLLLLLLLFQQQNEWKWSVKLSYQSQFKFHSFINRPFVYLFL